MKLFRTHGGAFALAFAVLFAPTVVMAQATCNTSTPPCSGAPGCAAGCGNSISIYHPSVSPCGSAAPAGGFDFSATEYAGTCLMGAGCTVRLPPIRFWQYDQYKKANSGCYDPVAFSTLANAQLDFSIGSPGQWILYQGNWLNGLQGDGCIAAANGELRTVVEFSFPNTPTENSINRVSWYMIASVPNTADYDFDTIQGGTGCVPGTIAPAPVPGLTIAGKTTPCVGSAAATSFAIGAPGFFDVPVTLANGSPDYFDEVSKSNAAKRLIAGYQVLYAGGTTADATSEPRSSDAALGGWQPARDPASPTNIAPVIPYSNTAATVSIPATACGASGCWFWLATRLVYQDQINALGSVLPAAGPLVVSDVSSHCGPVTFGTVVAVDFDSVTAERNNGGIRIAWKTLMEEDTLGFQVVRATGVNGNENIEVLPSQVESRGAFYPYEMLDYSVASDLTTTYTYYVQEITASGLGSRSASVTVPGAAAPTTSNTGGRNRGKARR